MHLLDFLLLSFALSALLLVTAARMTGKLPERGSGRSVQPESRLNRFDGAGIKGRLEAAKQSTFKGILAHHDGPVRLIPSLVTAS